MIAFTPTLRTLPYGEEETPIGGLLLDGKPMVRLPDLPFLLGYLSSGTAYDMARFTLTEEQVVRTHFYHEDGTRNRVTMFVTEQVALQLLDLLAQRRAARREGCEGAKQWLSTVFFPWLRSTAPQLAPAAVGTGITAREQVDAAIESLTGALQVLVAAREQLNAQ